jgi:7 transmembrane helices usually fused to an inactive transglutaminase
MNKILTVVVALIFLGAFTPQAFAATKTMQPTPLLSITPAPATSSPIPTPLVRLDITQPSREVEEPLKTLVSNMQTGSALINPLKHLVSRSVANGVPTNTLVLLLLLPTIATIVAGARHLVGLQGFGILLPAALGVTFLAVGPVAGLGLFLVITLTTTLSRVVLRRIKLRLHYLPRMSFLLGVTTLFVLFVLFLGSFIDISNVGNISIFPVLFLILLAEDFTRVQIGKSFRTAFNITTQTLFLALILYALLIQEGLQRFVILNPEWSIAIPLFASILLGKFSGLRFLEYYRFRRLIKS